MDHTRTIARRTVSTAATAARLVVVTKRIVLVLISRSWVWQPTCTRHVAVTDHTAHRSNQKLMHVIAPPQINHIVEARIVTAAVALPGRNVW